MMIKNMAAVLLGAFFYTTATAHQSMSFPTSISYTKNCRVGLGINCPGPCPAHNLRADQKPDKPAVTVRRGQMLRIKTYKNNHRGGFARWSLVKIKDMWSKQSHKRYAIYYSCADVRLTKCSSQNRGQFCPYDNKNEYYQHVVKIPEVYPDGVYVLGFAWYGGLISTGVHGAFGDYYDCSYIRISGGPKKWSYKAVFNAGPSSTGKLGLCASTVNRLGVCWREPCPGGVRKPQFLKPSEFMGRSPASITRDLFGTGSGASKASGSGKGTTKSPSRRPNGRPGVSSSSRVAVISLRVFDAARPIRTYGDSRRGSSFTINCSKPTGLAVVCDTRGNVKYVSFWINGRLWRNDWDFPYSMTRDFQVLFGTKISRRFTPWKVSRRRSYRATCEAVGQDGSRDKKTVNVRME